MPTVWEGWPRRSRQIVLREDGSIITWKFWIGGATGPRLTARFSTTPWICREVLRLCSGCMCGCNTRWRVRCGALTVLKPCRLVSDGLVTVLECARSEDVLTNLTSS